MSDGEWKPISEYSTDWNIEVECKNVDGKTIIGIPTPFWCGSDCPCSTLADWRNGVAVCGTEYFPPICWKIDDEENITMWRFIENVE